MDHFLKDVTVIEFRRTLLDAVERIDVIQPVALREPIKLWLRSVEQQARGWNSLLGRSVISPWNAAQAIRADDLKQLGDTP